MMKEEDIKTRLIASNPDLDGNVDILEVKEFLDDLQVNDLLSGAKEKNEKYHMLLKFLIGTGMKPTEVANLLLSDVDFKKRTIAVSSHEESKGVDSWSPRRTRQERMVQMDENLSLLLELFCTKNANDSKYVFTSIRSEHYSFMSILTVINRMATASVLIGKNIGSHVLRRTFALNKIRDGMKIDDLSRHLGHKSVAITLKYLFNCKLSSKSGFLHKEM